MYTIVLSLAIFLLCLKDIGDLALGEPIEVYDYLTSGSRTGCSEGLIHGVDQYTIRGKLNISSSLLRRNLFIERRRSQEISFTPVCIVYLNNCTKAGDNQNSACECHLTNKTEILDFTLSIPAQTSNSNATFKLSLYFMDGSTAHMKLIKSPIISDERPKLYINGKIIGQEDSHCNIHIHNNVVHIEYGCQCLYRLNVLEIESDFPKVVIKDLDWVKFYQSYSAPHKIQVTFRHTACHFYKTYFTCNVFIGNSDVRSAPIYVNDSYNATRMRLTSDDPGRQSSLLFSICLATAAIVIIIVIGIILICYPKNRRLRFYRFCKKNVPPFSYFSYIDVKSASSKLPDRIYSDVDSLSSNYNLSTWPPPIPPSLPPALPMRILKWNDSYESTLFNPLTTVGITSTSSVPYANDDGSMTSTIVKGSRLVSTTERENRRHSSSLTGSLISITQDSKTQYPASFDSTECISKTNTALKTIISKESVSEVERNPIQYTPLISEESVAEVEINPFQHTPLIANESVPEVEINPTKHNLRKGVYNIC